MASLGQAKSLGGVGAILVLIGTFLGAPGAVLAIIGATGSGKSEFALALARRTQAQILSVDSMQVYRGMDIGTAKPTPPQRRERPLPEHRTRPGGIHISDRGGDR